MAAYGQGKYAEAVKKFEAAFALIPHSDLLFNIARCHEQLKDFESAIGFYEKYLQTKPVDETAVIHRIRVLKERLGPLGDTPRVKTADTPKEPTAEEMMAEAPAFGDSAPIQWKYVAVGGGVVGAALGAWMGMEALTQAEKARDADERSEFDDAKASAESSAALADVSFLLSAASAGLAVWLFSADAVDDGMSSLSIGVGGRAIRVKVGF